MVAIADKLAKPQQSRLSVILDRPSILGPLFVSPAILYVFALVGIPFCLAVYYSVSAYTIYSQSYKFVGLANFIQIFQSDIFPTTLVNTFIFTFGSQILG